jgi:hypothetical protein
LAAAAYDDTERDALQDVREHALRVMARLATGFRNVSVTSAGLAFASAPFLAVLETRPAYDAPRSQSVRWSQ